MKPGYIGRDKSDVDILCTVTDKLAREVDALITPDMYEQSLEKTSAVHERPIVENVVPKAEGHDEPMPVAAQVETVSVSNEVQQTDWLECDADVGERERFRLRQAADSSLKEMLEQARARPQRTNEIEGLLYHNDSVACGP